MKKYVLGSMAVVLAIALSAFTHEDKLLKNQVTYYWAHVDAGEGGNSDFLNSEVTILSSTPSDTPPFSQDCIQTGYKCVVGFNANQLNATHTALVNPMGFRQPSQTTGYQRDEE